MSKKTVFSIILIIVLTVILALLLYLAFKPEENTSKNSEVEYSSTSNLHIDMTNWNYDEDNNVYWQIGIVYCSSPETKEYESMGIYVPGDYMNRTKNEDGTYTCTINTTNKVGNYTAETAPIVMPINTAGYSAQSAPTAYSYSGLSNYLNAGFVYVYSGARGRNNGEDYSGGAPWGVTDFKAAIRYLKYNSNNLPGNEESIFTFGHSGGGAQSSLIGATGDSEEYKIYLEAIGAIMYDDNGNYISDSVAGAMCWCPITSLDYANEAYEWNMGQYASTGTRADTTWTSVLSDDLATAYASYINALGLKDEYGNTLILEQSENGIYASGSYYDYILSVIENSLNNFLEDTEFPYTPTSSFKASGEFGGSGEKNTNGGIKENKTGSNNESTTYQSASEYIAALNSDEQWITYNSSTNTVKISSIKAFVNHCKSASKDVGAFDDLNRTQAENYVFGNDESDSLHWDSVMAELLKENAGKYAEYSDYDSSKIEEYANDMENVDKFGITTQIRQNMYNPMYYISDYYEGYKTSNVAKYWRIRTGIEQGDTALTVEANLALALEQYDGIEDVDFETVWEQAHTTAERTGDSTTNFIEWVNECLSD